MLRAIRWTGIVCGLALAAAAFACAAHATAQPSEVVRWFGDSSSATGNALAGGTCDVNGDGFDDAVVGAWFWDRAPDNNIGAAYVLFGAEDVSGGDLNSPAAAGAARIDGPAVANAFVGFAVNCLGDVNGDGLDDLAISHYVEEKVYVVLGAREFGSIDLGNFGDRGFEIRGSTDPAFDYNVGFSIGPAGDIDDDGLGDIAVAGVVADTLGRTNNGRVWVVAGKEDVANVDLLDPGPGAVLQTIDGAGSEDRLGAIAPAGDVNGDGVDDLVVGAYTSTPWGPSVAVPGAAWAIWGDGPQSVDLAAVGTAGFAVSGPQRGRDRLGISVAGAGDVNGDGFADLLVGGDGVFNAATGQRPGSAWVVFGDDSSARVYTDASPASAAAVYSCANDDGTGVCAAGETQARGYWIEGADSDPGNGSESTGYSVAGIGDVSGDGVPDFAIGAHGYDPIDPANPPARLTGAGAVWVVHGKASPTTQPLASLAAADGYRIDGLAAGDRFGRQVAGLGDLDGNGSADFAGAGDFSQRPLPPATPRSQAGEVAVALVGPLRTETALEASPASVTAGSQVALRATITVSRRPGDQPQSGTATFTANTAPIAGCGAVPVAGGAAECTTSSLAVGTSSIRAAYSGAGDLGSSSSDAVTVTVAAPASPGPYGETPEEEPPPGGGKKADVHVGTSGPDVIRGRGGRDRIRGKGGDDRLFGGGGADRLTGRAGDDHLTGGPGDDRLEGGAGDDRLTGGAGDDRLAGGPGRDVCRRDAADTRAPRGCEVIRGPGEDDTAPPIAEPEGPSGRPEPPLSDAYVNRGWQPTPYDTCPKWLHDAYTVVGPDGKLYPTWHPPRVTDPSTGQLCTFGHEHGANPAGSDLAGWVSGHLAAGGYEDRAGIPFGYASEELITYAAANPGTPTRFEDHVGHKVDYVNDLRLLDADGRYVEAPGPNGDPVRVECDFLTKLHQGSHSLDATQNNAHELLYAVRCNDGTELISTTLVPFGAAGEFNRSCAPTEAVATGATGPYPDGGGSRLIPDRGCVERYVLVPPTNPSAYSDIWALYENWRAEAELRAGDGTTLASFDPWFAVRNPSRYQAPAAAIGRTLAAAWETDVADGGVANRPPWSDVQALAPFEHRDPRSPFDGAQRELYLRETTIVNDGGPRRWYTDPYGRNASPAPFSGAICQLIASRDTSGYPELKRRVFGRDDDYGAANGVHAPN